MTRRNGRYKNHIKRRGHLFFLFLIFIAIVCLSGVCALTDGNGPDARPAGVSAAEKQPPAPSTQTGEPADKPRDDGQSELRILTYGSLAKEVNGDLALVNGDNAVPRFTPALASVSSYVRTLNTDCTMDEGALAMLKAMFSSAKDAGYGDFRVTDGYRTLEQQQTLYDSMEDKSLVALPGHSEHQTGLAADISYDGVDISNSSQGRWLMENSYKYGFILRYPKQKKDITGFSFEPWHYRYVGQPHASFIHQYGLVLEEYVDYLKRNGEVTAVYDGVRYAVYYLSGYDDAVGIPKDYSYSASSDNTGGIVVTAWKGE